MPQFIYRSTRTMEPRPGVNYATTYFKMTHSQTEAMTTWLAMIGRDIEQVIQRDQEWSAWLSQPLRGFRKSQKGQYYTMLELLTDMLGQLVAGKDLPEAMIGRWNRLCSGTPWAIEMTDQNQPTPALHSLLV